MARCLDNTPADLARAAAGVTTTALSGERMAKYRLTRRPLRLKALKMSDDQSMVFTPSRAVTTTRSLADGTGHVVAVAEDEVDLPMALNLSTDMLSRAAAHSLWALTLLPPSAQETTLSSQPPRANTLATATAPSLLTSHTVIMARSQRLSRCLLPTHTTCMTTTW